MHTVKIVAFCIFAFVFSITGATKGTVKVEIKVLASPNGTSHIFHLPPNLLKDTLVALFRFGSQFENPYLERVFRHYGFVNLPQIFLNSKTAKDGAYCYGKFCYDFKKPGTENDVIIDGGRPWDSPVYHEYGTPLPYYTPFVLKLKSIDKEHTQVTIETVDPQVFISKWYWTQCWDCGIWGIDSRSTPVQSTTIEEHTLLLYIADKLGDKTVEALQMPEPFVARSGFKHQLLQTNSFP
ncbi:MAG: hypothetical protein V4722_06270 [Bacteroidota bacterium]